MEEIRRDHDLGNMDIAMSDAPEEEKKHTKGKKAALVEALAKTMLDAAMSMKQVGNLNFNEKELKSFFETCLAFGNLTEYQTSVVAPDGVSYVVKDYKIDARFAGFIPAISISMEGDPFSVKDLACHDSAIVCMTPVEFAVTQQKVLGSRKLAFQPVDVTSKRMYHASVKDVMKGDFVHCENMNSVKELPVRITIADKLWEDSYFAVPLKAFLKQLMYNILA